MLPPSSSELALKLSPDECRETSVFGEGQLLTESHTVNTQNTSSNQPDRNKTNSHQVINAHILVKRTNRRKASRKTNGSSGGHKTTRYLTHEEWREAKSNAYAIINSGYRWTIFVSIRPPTYLSDGEKQKRVQLILARIGQALKRRKVPHIAMRIYEKPVGGSLHGHALIFTPKEHFDVIERLVDKFDRGARKKLDKDISVETHAREIGPTHDDLRRAILYLLKEHLWAGPGYDGAGSARMFYEKGEPIRGCRVGYSSQAKTILANYSKRLFAAIPLGSRVVSETQNEPTQLSFGNDWIALDIRQAVEQERLRRQMTQAEAGAVIGYRQPGYNNSIVRRHDPLSAWVRNRALDFIVRNRAA